MPWEAEVPGLGFTTGDPWLPFGSDAAERAVDHQRDDDTSTLSAYRRLLAARAELVEQGSSAEILDLASEVVAVQRGSLVAVLNTADGAVDLPLTGELIAATADGAGISDGRLTVPTASTVWLRTRTPA